ncbi:Abi family protein [Pseudomonas urmiensis]|jgi:hypothetical protein|uniref:Abi family protein n=1 Tax=Pseudomonas urmiensis TaxID=2745493 RepID=A0A923FVV0_9PSED|nr:Abi family protein [Pseudomonas urmiensis]MBV4537886.1 Abi family protein [Pseudomonas urmiensis]
MHFHLTAPRLKTLDTFFVTTSDSDLLGCYAWTQAVGAALLPILGDLEVSLRNALHRGLSQYYSGADSFEWMLKTRPNPSSPAEPTYWHKLTRYTHEDVLGAVGKIAKKKGKGNATVDDIVAKVPFGFWETIIKGLKHKSHPAGMQASVLSIAFPNAPDLATTPYDDAAFVDRLANLLSQVRDVRNRIGHHDQIWRTPEFDSYGNLGFIPRRPRQTVNSLRLLANQITWLAGWIDPEITNYIKASDHWWSLQALLTKEALTVYRKNGGRVGTYEAVIRTTPQHEVVTWPNKTPRTPEKIHRINRRRVSNKIFY